MRCRQLRNAPQQQKTRECNGAGAEDARIKMLLLLTPNEILKKTHAAAAADAE